MSQWLLNNYLELGSYNVVALFTRVCSICTSLTTEINLEYAFCGIHIRTFLISLKLTNKGACKLQIMGIVVYEEDHFSY